MVTRVESEFPMQQYCQLARSQNLGHSSEFYVQFNLADILYSLRTEYDSWQEIKICGICQNSTCR